MKKQWITGTRYCVNCGEDTIHELLYLGEYLKAGRCETCGAHFENRRMLLQVYLQALMDRVVSKPYRVYQETKQTRAWYRPRTWFGYGRYAIRVHLSEAHNLREILAEEFKEIDRSNKAEH